VLFYGRKQGEDLVRVSGGANGVPESLASRYRLSSGSDSTCKVEIQRSRAVDALQRDISFSAGGVTGFRANKILFFSFCCGGERLVLIILDFLNDGHGGLLWVLGAGWMCIWRGSDMITTSCG
jgi:hypothetical protein